MAAARTASTINNYKTALHSFMAYAKRDLPTCRVDANAIEGYQRWLRDRGICLNTISCYMRSLRALYSRVAEPVQEDPFKHVFTGNTRTEKRSVSKEDIRRLTEVRLPRNSSLELARDLFLFCFYAMGMPFVDVAHLQWTQLAEGFITYHRHKTGQRIRVHIEPCMQAIIDRYRARTAGSPYVFPLLTAATAEGSQREYAYRLHNYNKALKRLTGMAGLSRPLTSYVARHTWASLAFHANVDLPVISKALGHTNTQTTLTYIREIDDHRLDVANAQLCRQFR